MKNIEYAGIRWNSCDDGVGIRTVVFLQGCSRNCPGCHNKMTHIKGMGKMTTTDVLFNIINEKCLNKKVTISGGEPLEQKEALTELLMKLKSAGYNTCLYTSWSLNAVEHAIIDNLDYIKTGEFRENEKDSRLHFVGSLNQRMYNRDKYGKLNEIRLMP